MATRGNIFLKIRNKDLYVGTFKMYDCYPMALGNKLMLMDAIDIRTYILSLSKHNGEDTYQYIFKDKKYIYEHLKHSDVSYAYIFSYDDNDNFTCEIRHYYMKQLGELEFENVCDEIWYSLDDAINDYESK